MMSSCQWENLADRLANVPLKPALKQRIATVNIQAKKIVTLFILSCLTIHCGTHFSNQKNHSSTDDPNNHSAHIDEESDPDTSKPPRHSSTSNMSKNDSQSHNPSGAEDDSLKSSNHSSKILCTAPDEISNKPQSIEDVIRLINALPKPVTLECYLESLARPLELNASSSQLSVQRADSEKSPRFFIFQNNLISSVTLGSEGQNLLELSLLINEQKSVKGEIPFPVTDSLQTNAAYKNILRNDNKGTRCGACHLEEVKAVDPIDSAAFVSKAIKPFDYSRVDLEDLAAESHKCAEDSSERCKLLRALMEHGEVLPKNFSNEMSMLF